MKQAKNISVISTEVKTKRLYEMVREAQDFNPDMQPVYISRGNAKTGDLVPSVSLRPVLDCGNCGVCSGLCYDLRNVCRYQGVRDTRAHNFKIWSTDPDRYFAEISTFCRTQIAFRWHIGGDIKNAEYLAGMVKVARENKHTSFLVFTKRFDLVNEFLAHHRKPSNLQIIFSGWKGLKIDNPYNLPTSHPIFADGTTSAPDGAKWCGGNCSECFVQGAGCWTLKKGEAVIFAAH